VAQSRLSVVGPKLARELPIDDCPLADPFGVEPVPDDLAFAAGEVVGTPPRHDLPSAVAPQVADQKTHVRESTLLIDPVYEPQRRARSIAAIDLDGRLAFGEARGHADVVGAVIV